MAFNSHAGHNPAGKVACGAVGLLNESVENRKINKEIIRLLKLNGHTVYDCTVSNGTSQRDVLKKIVAKCNKHDVSYDFSHHLNSGRNDKKGDGSIGGFEVLVTDTGKGKGAIAERMRKNMKELGFKDRGTKIRKDLYVLNQTNAPAILTEICFVDDKDDYNLYKKVGHKAIAEALVKAILNKSSIKTGAEKFEPYLARITCKSLNVRAGAGTKYKVITKVKKDEVYTIVDEVKNESTTWGLLKSGTEERNMWISLNYAKKV